MDVGRQPVIIAEDELTILPVADEPEDRDGFAGSVYPLIVDVDRVLIHPGDVSPRGIVLTPLVCVVHLEGELGGDRPVLARVHSSCVTSEFYGACDCDCAAQLDGASPLEKIEAHMTPEQLGARKCVEKLGFQMRRMNMNGDTIPVTRAS